jgi:RNA polymerase sigma-70 factor (ECF subfamily)
MLDDVTYNDEQLVTLLSEGNEVAFAKIYDRYWKLLYISAQSILQRKEAAKDVVQEVFLSLWQRRTVVQIESLKGWLLQAVRFQVFKAIRADKASNDFYKRLSLVSKDIIAQDPLLFKEFQSTIQDAIRSLPCDHQVIFNMSREKGMTYSQIAIEKNISIKTVEKKISQVLRHLRDSLDKTMLTFCAFSQLLNI